MASPTVYRWDDASAPQILNTGMPQIQAVFQACLIDGYGAKLPPVSGTNKWTIPFSDATSFILQQGGIAVRKCAIKLYGLSSGYCSVIAAVDWTDLNTPIGTWVGSTTSYRLPIGFIVPIIYHGSSSLQNDLLLCSLDIILPLLIHIYLIQVVIMQRIITIGCLGTTYRHYHRKMLIKY